MLAGVFDAQRKSLRVIFLDGLQQPGRLAGAVDLRTFDRPHTHPVPLAQLFHEGARRFLHTNRELRADGDVVEEQDDGARRGFRGDEGDVRLPARGSR